jgi:hypothetical protein
MVKCYHKDTTKIRTIKLVQEIIVRRGVDFTPQYASPHAIRPTDEAMPIAQMAKKNGFRAAVRNVLRLL